ncbi:MAG: hypothetical protein ACOH1J_01240 [Microbacteriaceae bacterium]
MNRNVDYSALLYPVSTDDVKAFKKRLKQSGSLWGTRIVANQVGLVIALVVILMFGAFQVPLLMRFTGSDAGGSALTSVLLPVGVVMVIGVFVFTIVRRFFSNSSYESWFRLEGFARANGYVFSPSSAAPNYPGAIFGLGTNQQRLDHIFSLTGRDIDMGNYRYVTKSGKNSTTHNWGYLAFRLDRKLPHMVLDSRANNGIFGGTNLPRMFNKNQTLSLEGDFNTHFTLYCPREYERDALYVFTPDLMALLIDEASPFDVEIIDDWMFIYTPKPFPKASPGVYQRLFRIVDTVAAKTLTQTDRYADERIGDPSVNLVAPKGQRLKAGINVSTIVIIALVAAVWLFFALNGVVR